MKNTSKFQNVVIVTIVGWLVLFVFLPNLMIIGTSFLTRDDASFVKMVFTLDNYTRLLDPLYFEVLLHSLNMALIATLACLVLGYPFAWFLAKLPHKVRPLLLFLLFEAVAVTLWLTKDNFFYLLNFSYIGACLGLGTALFTAGKRYARHFVQLAVGSYMLLYLGVISRENMQIEGFWYYLFLGVFEAATIHYAVAKIFGPLLFGRGWCGYACWTAMVLDFLPYNQPQKPRKEKLGILRYVMFLLSLALVSGLFLMQVAHLEQIMFWLFLAGNTLYYLVGIVFAFLFQDNRAFCKYLCPITVFLKPMSYFSLLRVHCDEDKCVHCRKCLQVCPMNVEVNKETRKRKNGTECILCYECTKVCPSKALH